MKQNWFSQLFCTCVREEPQQQSKFVRTLTSEMRKPQELSSVEKIEQQQGWLQKQTSLEVDCQNSIEAAEKKEEKFLHNRQLSYMEFMNKTSFSDEFKSGQVELKLIYRSGGMLSRQTQQYVDFIQNEWLLRIFKEEQIINYKVLLFYFIFFKKKVSKYQEREFQNQMIPMTLCDIICKKVKSDTVLLSHDPTGSLLFRLASKARQIFYLEEQQYKQVIHEIIKQLQIENKVHRIIKTEINQRIDCVILNLLNQDDLYLKHILFEYLTLGHDLIVILPSKLDNQIIYSSAEAATSQSEQARNHCSVHLQQIYENQQLIAKVLYFGEASEIQLNEELNYLYSCIPDSAKKKYNYKAILKDVRNQIGMTKLVQLFKDTQLLYQGTDINFQMFLSHSRVNINNEKYINHFTSHNGTESASSTESEEDEDYRKIFEKEYSKSEEIPQFSTKTKIRQISQPIEILL